MLRSVGAFLLVFAVVVAYCASRAELPRAAVGELVVANVLWALVSVAVVVAEWFTPSTTGQVWILLQAGAVAAFAGLQGWELRRTA